MVVREKMVTAIISNSVTLSGMNGHFDQHSVYH